MARPSRLERAGATAKKSLSCFVRFRRVLNKLDHLAFRNSPNLVQVKTAFAFGFLGIRGGTEKRVCNHGQAGNRGATHGQHKFPVSE